MDGQELLDIYPEEILEGAEEERLDQLAACADELEFKQKLRQLAQRSYPVWIFGLPRTGSSWLTKYFFGSVTEPVYQEPWQYYQCASAKWDETQINCDTNHEFSRPEITRKLELYKPPLDRLTLAVHKRFVFKFLFDFNIVPLILEHFPRSRFVWLTRDGRDQIESFHNPDTDHWPQTEFEFLGEGQKKRFAMAAVRFVRFTKRQLEILQEYKRRIAVVQYEKFTEDFSKQASDLLKFTGFSTTDKNLERQEQNFDARHGMWEDWELWQRQIFFESDADTLNFTIGYGKKDIDNKYVWKRPFPEDKREAAS